MDAVPNPVEPLSTEACEKVREIEKKPIIQFVGRYGPEKGLNRILESFAACAADFPEWVLRINGNGLEEEILAVEKYLAQLDPETAQRVELGGVLNAEEVIEHFAESSLAVMASDFEGLPMSFLELCRWVLLWSPILLPAHFKRWCLKWGILRRSPALKLCKSKCVWR